MTTYFLPSAGGFHEGQRVRVLVPCSGADHEDIEHQLPAGRVGTIEHINRYPSPQGLAFTVYVPVDGERGITNVFDESDGDIRDFIEPETVAGSN
ncbi:hypothetical protein OOZ54_12765 [Rhodopseudomonas palustris]|uniref:hypothetical protein n=1 Tax=Rhodopseudomonas palustris TaxID=1076 RepID=UPI0022F0936F|nr:hypothetical protein [Rhodopseudomonas palustris]WBU27566.1 hypothetical protein OOZ54_12765 [Rhodopseudomonas palustris]